MQIDYHPVDNQTQSFAERHSARINPDTKVFMIAQQASIITYRRFTIFKIHSTTDIDIKYIITKNKCQPTQKLITLKNCRTYFLTFDIETNAINITAQP